MRTRGLPNSPRDERAEARKMKRLKMAKAQSRERRRNEKSKGKAHEEAGEAHEEAGEAHEEAVAADEAERNSGEPETNISNQATESFIKQERDVAYEMWVNESDPDDVDFVGDKESTRDDVEGDGGSCEGSVEEEEAAGEVVSKKRKRKRGASVASDDEEEEEETEVVSDDVAQSESEDEEDLVERFELEVEDDVAQFVDELSIQRREIPDSDSEAEDPMVVRNKKIRRGIGDRLAVGNAFINGAEFKEAVLDYILSSGYNIRQTRYEATKITFKCGMDKCKWSVYASFNKGKQLWYVKTRFSYHSCTSNGKCRYLQAPVIAKLFMDKLRLDPAFMPAKIQEHIKEQWKFVSTRPQCQGGRLKALAAIEKEHEFQYAHIRGYAQEILNSNPGSTVVVETKPGEDGKELFDRIYIGFDILRKCWRGSCRPIIGLDGTFLKVAVKGCLLAAVGHDANNQIYPIAWAVVQSETADNWLWFIRLLKVDLGLGDGSDVVIISDRGRGLLAAVKEELPNVEHRMCVKHIVENLKSKGQVGKDLLKPLVWKLAWCYNTTAYRGKLMEIKEYDMGLYEAVMNEEPETWCLAFYKVGSCCEDVHNNSTESFNATITKARAKALIPMLETIRRQVMERISKRCKKSMKRQEKCTKYVADILAKEKKDAERCKTYSGTHGIYEVFLDGESYRVNIPKSTCTCCKWQISGIPCEHAYGAMLDFGMNAEDHTAVWFRTDLWQMTYDTAIRPMRGPKFWMTSEYELVNAPKPPTLPGKKKETKKQKIYPRKKGKHESPKKKTKKAEKETMSRKGRIMHCKSCGVAGHNAAGCKKFPKDKQQKKQKKQTMEHVGSSSGQPAETISLTQPSQATQTTTDNVA